MKRSKFSEEQVAYALRQADAGTAVGDVCRLSMDGIFCAVRGRLVLRTPGFMFGFLVVRA